jgi:hypothetical protein
MINGECIRGKMNMSWLRSQIAKAQESSLFLIPTVRAYFLMLVLQNGKDQTANAMCFYNSFHFIIH